MDDPDAPLGASVASTYELTNRLERLYVSYYDRYVMAVNGAIFIPMAGRGEERHPRRLDNRVMVAHMKRRLSVGVFAGEKSSKFICFDVDLEDQSVVQAIVNTLTAAGFPRQSVHVSSSGGKGYHIEIFFNKLMSTSVLRRLYNYVLDKTGLDPHKVEFRPTHGQAIKLPLSKHPKTGQVCWFLDRDSLEPIKSVDYLLTIEPVERDWASDLIAKLPVPEPPKKARVKATSPLPFEPGDLTVPGTRHHMMLSLAVRLRGEGRSQEEIAEALAAWVARQRPELMNDDPEFDIDAMAAWVWSPGFKVGAVREAVITADEMAAIMSLAKGNARKILFLLVVLCKRFGRATISAERCASYVGCTGRTAITALRALAEAGIIKAVRGKVKMVDGHPVSAPNTYTVTLPAGGESIPIPVPFVPETFESVWKEASGLIGSKDERRKKK